MPHLDAYLKELINNINATCDNARSAFNLLMGISLFLGAFTLGIDDMALFLDSKPVMPYLDIQIKVSSVFLLGPILYILIYCFVINKLYHIIRLYEKYKQHIRFAEDKKIDNLFRPFFYLDYLKNNHLFDKILSNCLTNFIPTILLMLMWIKFIPYQSNILMPIYFVCILIIQQACLSFLNQKGLILYIFFYILCIYLSIINIIYCYFLLADISRSKYADYKQISYLPRLHLENLHDKDLVEQPVSPEIINAVLIKCKNGDPYRCDYLIQKAQEKYAKGLMLRNRSFRGINLNNSNLYNIDLQGSDLLGASAENSNFYKSNLSSVILRHANFRFADLDKAELNEVDLYEADLYEADLFGADLKWAYLYKADIRQANLQKANLKGAKLQGADLSKSFYNDKKIISKNESFNVRYSTVFPENFDPIQRKMLNLCNPKDVKIILGLNSRFKGFYFDKKGTPAYECVDSARNQIKDKVNHTAPLVDKIKNTF